MSSPPSVPRARSCRTSSSSGTTTLKFCSSSLAGPTVELQNFIFVGHNASNLEERADLGRAAALEWRASDALLDSYPVLTDDFAPLEYYAANAIRRYDAISRRAH